MALNIYGVTHSQLKQCVMGGWRWTHSRRKCICVLAGGLGSRHYMAWYKMHLSRARTSPAPTGFSRKLGVFCASCQKWQQITLLTSTPALIFPNRCPVFFEPTGVFFCSSSLKFFFFSFWLRERCSPEPLSPRARCQPYGLKITINMTFLSTFLPSSPCPSWFIQHIDQTEQQS